MDHIKLLLSHKQEAADYAGNVENVCDVPGWYISWYVRDFNPGANPSTREYKAVVNAAMDFIHAFFTAAESAGLLSCFIPPVAACVAVCRPFFGRRYVSTAQRFGAYRGTEGVTTGAADQQQGQEVSPGCPVFLYRVFCLGFIFCPSLCA